MNNIYISIPRQCHEDWNKMTKTQKGKFCGVCTKEVIDFTHYSDEQLIKYLNSNNNLCGRFTQQQLDRDLVIERRKNWFISKPLVAGLFSLFVLNSHTTKAQEKPKTEQTDKKYTSIPLKNTNSQKEITVSGIVVDENNLPLPGATISIKGSRYGTTTNFDGQFKLQCKTNAILIVSYLGYLNQEIKKGVKNNVINIKMKVDKKTREKIVPTALGFVKINQK